MRLPRLSERGRWLMLVPAFWAVVLLLLFSCGSSHAAGTCTTWHRMDVDGSYADDIDVGPAADFCSAVAAFHTAGSTISGCGVISVTEYHASWAVSPPAGGQYFYVASRNGCTPDGASTTTLVLPDFLNLSAEDGALLAAAIVSIWALAFSVRAVTRALGSDNDGET